MHFYELSFVKKKYFFQTNALCNELRLAIYRITYANSELSKRLAVALTVVNRMTRIALFIIHVSSVSMNVLVSVTYISTLHLPLKI